MRRAKIAGTGFYVPEWVLNNEDMSRLLGQPVPSSIEEKLGIRERHLTGDAESSADLAVKAGERAIADAGLEPQDIDLVIVATDTPEYISPPTAAPVHGRLGTVNAGFFDLNASCTGFVMGLDVASRMIASGNQYNNILLIGVYNMSKFVDPKNARVAPIFADGGGAVVLRATDGDEGFQASQLYADGTQYDFLGIYAGGTKKPITRERLENGEHLLTFLKPLPPDRNIKAWPGLVEKALAKAGLTVRDVDHILFTQINRSVIVEVMDILGLDLGKTTMVMDRYGYTGSACIPMALHEALKGGKIRKGDIVVMVASGVGLSMAVAVFKW